MRRLLSSVGVAAALLAPLAVPSADAAATATTTTATDWHELSPPVQPQGVGDTPGLTFDGRTQRLVLAAGNAGGGTTGSTWTFDGRTWTKHTTGLPQNQEYRTAYDSRRTLLVAVGGPDAAGTPMLIWRWTGTYWARIKTTHSPTARTGYRVAYDPISHRLLMFGGYVYNSGDSAETWTFNGIDWTKLAPALSPPARDVPALATDGSRGVLMFGGKNLRNDRVLGDTWRWTGSTWKRLYPGASPAPRYQAAATYDEHLAGPVLFGGTTATATGGSGLADTWRWTGSTWQRVSTAHAPSRRYGAGLSYDPALHRSVLFGGQGPHDTYGPYNQQTWTLG